MRTNPKDLNSLQLRTLAIFQVLASFGTPDAEGNITIDDFPHAHGDHMHVGAYSMHAKDGTGLANEAVWTALERKGLLASNFPVSATLTKEGQEYPIGHLPIFHGHAHHH